jgi:hypothetical protein
MNGPVCYVETSPEIVCVYRAYLSNDCTQNFSYRYAVEGHEKIALSWTVQFKFMPLRIHVTAAWLAVVLYSPVHSNKVSGARCWLGCERLGNCLTHTYTYTLKPLFNESLGDWFFLTLNQGFPFWRLCKITSKTLFLLIYLLYYMISLYW